MAISDAQSGGLILSSSVPYQITLAGTVVKGDLIGYSSGWKRALATTGTAIQAKCVASQAGKSGDTIVAYFGKCIVGGRYSGGTPGTQIYSAEGTSNGQITETAPSTGGDCNKCIGIQLSATEVLIDCNANLDTTG